MTLDNHYVHGGQGDMVAAAIAALALSPSSRVTRLGLTELPQCGTNDEVLHYHTLDVDGLSASMQQAWRASPATVGASQDAPGTDRRG